MPPFEHIWRGNDLTTTWSHPGDAPRSFQAEFIVDWTAVGKLTGPQPWPMKEGKGTIYDGQRFTVRNGLFDFINNTVSFDMIFDEAHPSEEFFGTLNLADNANGHDDIESIKGTIKVKSTWLEGKRPEVYGPYSRYQATVTLR